MLTILEILETQYTTKSWVTRMVNKSQSLGYDVKDICSVEILSALSESIKKLKPLVNFYQKVLTNVLTINGLQAVPESSVPQMPDNNFPRGDFDTENPGQTCNNLPRYSIVERELCELTTFGEFNEVPDEPTVVSIESKRQSTDTGTETGIDSSLSHKQSIKGRQTNRDTETFRELHNIIEQLGRNNREIEESTRGIIEGTRGIIGEANNRAAEANRELGKVCEGAEQFIKEIGGALTEFVVNSKKSDERLSLHNIPARLAQLQQETIEVHAEEIQ